MSITAENLHKRRLSWHKVYKSKIRKARYEAKLGEMNCQGTVAGLRLTTEAARPGKTSYKLSQVEHLIIAEATQRLATKNRPNMSNFEQNFKEKSAIFDGGKLNEKKRQ